VNGVRIAIALLMALYLVGCQPAGQSVAIYTRNDSIHEFIISTEPVLEPALLMAVNGGGGCSRFARPWSFLVHAGGAPPAGEPPIARLDSDDVAPGDVAIWIHAQADGMVLVGQGVPPWWEGQVQTCG
jgi:hypothetical protein